MKSATLKPIFLIIAAALLSNCAGTGSGATTANTKTGSTSIEIIDNLDLQETEANPPPVGSAADPELMLADADAVEAAVDPKKKMVCTIERPTGSHIPKKYCRSVWDIEREREASRAMIEKMQNSPTWNQ